MNQNGFFGAIFLLAAIRLLALLYSSEAGEDASAMEIQGAVATIQKASFERSQAEIYFDNAIRQALEENTGTGIEAAMAKEKVNSRIISSFMELGLDAALCKKRFNLPPEKISGLGQQSLSKASKAIAMQAGGATITQYSITGGEDADLFPCAEIRVKNYSTPFELPVGYTATATVLHA